MANVFSRLLNRILPPVQKQPSIACIINFCTHDSRFLNSCIREVSGFADQVIVACSDHFFDGMPENKELLEKAEAENPKAQFIYLSFNRDESSDPQYWVTLSRWNALSVVEDGTEYIQFLDADEIVDGKRMKQFLDAFPLHRFNIIKLANYYYFRESRFRARSLEDSVILVRKNLLTREMVVDYQDRNKSWEMLPEPKQRMVMGSDDRPLIHHFSWVRTKEEMLRKVQSWGHAGERNWVSMVEEEFSRPFSGKDFIHGYDYEEVSPPFPETGL
jgi:hypothetical protein